MREISGTVVRRASGERARECRRSGDGYSRQRIAPRIMRRNCADRGLLRRGMSVVLHPHADQVAVIYRSFQLAPSTPQHTDHTLDELLARKYGRSLGEARAMNQRVT